MEIAVTTPTGNVGREVVALLVNAGIRPRVLLRDRSRLDSRLADWVEPIEVDLGDGAAVERATSGVDALYWVDPPTYAADPIAEYARTGAIAARSIVANDISHTVFQSSVGAELRHGAGEIDGLARTEELLDETGRDVLHLRCGFFFSNLLLQLDAIRAGVIPVVLPVDQPLAWVAPRDIAQVAVSRLLAANWSGSQVQAVHGPADLSWNEAAAVLSKAIGKKVRVERISDDEMRQLLRAGGMGDGLVEAVLGMSVGLRDRFVPEQPRTPVSSTPTTLAAWCHDTVRPLL